MVLHLKTKSLRVDTTADIFILFSNSENDTNMSKTICTEPGF